MNIRKTFCLSPSFPIVKSKLTKDYKDLPQKGLCGEIEIIRRFDEKPKSN